MIQRNAMEALKLVKHIKGTEAGDKFSRGENMRP